MNSFSFSEHDRRLSLYHYAAETGEYCGQKEVFIPAHTGLPQYCTENAPPPLMKGVVAVFDGEQWQKVDDHRGKRVYHIKTGHAFLMTAIGALDAEITLQKPSSPFDHWNGTGWVLDKDKLAATARRYRNAFIIATDGLTLIDYSIEDRPLTPEQRVELMAVRAAYKAWPTQANWPLIALPDLPHWLLIEAVNNGYVVPTWPPVHATGA